MFKIPARCQYRSRCCELSFQKKTHSSQNAIALSVSQSSLMVSTSSRVTVTGIRHGSREEWEKAYSVYHSLCEASVKSPE